MTLRQLGELTERFELRQQREGLFVGLLASVTANYSMRAPTEPLCAADFVPGLKRPVDLDDDDAVAARIDALFGAVAVPAAPKL